MIFDFDWDLQYDVVLHFSRSITGLKVHDLGDMKFDDFSEDPTFGNVNRPRAVGSANRRVGIQLVLITES